MESSDWSGKIIVVTGGAQGIGAATCEAFASLGATVVCGDINCAAAQFPPHLKGNIHVRHLDASERESCRSLVQFAAALTGCIDVLVNNVGVMQPPVPIHELDDSHWDRVMTVNVKSVFWMCKFAMPFLLKSTAAAIVNNASIQAINSQPGVAAYAASKGALAALTRQLAVEYGPRGVRVNAVSPGTTLTAMGRDNTDLSYVLPNTPAGRVGDPADIARAVLFLAGPGWVCGHNLVVDGGVTVKGGWCKL